MSLLDELTIEDLDDNQRELADCIGLEAYKKLVKRYAGEPITVRMPDRLTLRLRNERIFAEFNGCNYKELSKQYGLHERTIRKIISMMYDEIRNQPLEGQISFYNEEV
ncbi:MAG: DNA-binding protein [Oscillospiraceae bacterium]|nr:DNA-binding protein [Oscillospiraceae bacterium]